MNPIYKFYLQINEDGQKQPVRPVWKDDMTLDYEQETNQRFYRAKLSGKLDFIRDDFDLIMSAAFDSTYYLYIEKSSDNGVTFTQYYKSQFFRTDCEINVDDKKITVKPDPIDEYNDVLAGLEKEYNLINLAPEIERLVLRKRPLIQLYVPGDNIVSCFLSGMNWEQDAQEITNVDDLVQKYYFALCNILKEVQITSNGTPNDIGGVYSGRMSPMQGQIDTWEGKLYPQTNNGYYIYVVQQKELTQSWDVWVSDMQIRRSSDDKAFFELATGGGAFETREFDLAPVDDSGATGTAHANMKSYSIFARYLLDVESFRGLTTYELPVDDLVENNRNYRRVIGYAIDVAYISDNYSDTPTEYGRADNGQYFAPPYSFYGDKFYPIARSTWRYASLWFAFSALDYITEESAHKTYTLCDTFPVSSVISVLLAQFAPGITHEATPEYSQFLYGNYNPISGLQFKLLVTQKSNLLVGDYQDPAQQAPTTLRQFMDMLKNCFQLYWYIDNGKFKIEHVSWFKNGGTYTGGAVIGYDLTKLENIRNGKKWAFGTSNYSFDKVDLAERLQFEWADNVTEPFRGVPIEIISKYITPGKIEEITVSNFTSDVDLMLLNPGQMSLEGFALFAAVAGNALKERSSYGGLSSRGTDGYTTPKHEILSDFWGKSGVLSLNAGGGGSGHIVFYNGDTVISTQGTFAADGQNKQINVTIPNNTTAIGYLATGTINVSTYSLIVEDVNELPFVQYQVQYATYYLQNGYLAMINLQPEYWTYDLPARNVKINGLGTYARGLERKKKQTLQFPVENINPLQLVKTNIGSGQIDKISVNLSSQTAKATLKYDTE